jgi:hypothetical protein
LAVQRCGDVAITTTHHTTTTWVVRKCSLKPTVIRHASYVAASGCGQDPPPAAPRGGWRMDPVPFPDASELGRRDKRMVLANVPRGCWPANRPTDSPRQATSPEVAVLTRGGCNASIAATSHDEDSALTETPPRGELARPPIDTASRVNRTETLLSSGRIPRHDGDTSSETATLARSNHNASAAATGSRQVTGFHRIPTTR